MALVGVSASAASPTSVTPLVKKTSEIAPMNSGRNRSQSDWQQIEDQAASRVPIEPRPAQWAGSDVTVFNEPSYN